MRLIFGIILGAALTIGAAAYHDNNVPDGRPARLADREIVNWDVLGAVIQRNTALLRRLWNDATSGEA